MTWRTPEKAVFETTEDRGDVIVGCRWWRARHGAKAGGNLSGIVFPFGSDRNILAAPCSTQISVRRDGEHLTFANDIDRGPTLTHGREDDRVWVESESGLVGPGGERLPMCVRHRFVYHPWGYVRQRVTVECLESVPAVWQFQVARPVVSPWLNEFAYRPAPTDDASWHMACQVHAWHKLEAGDSYHDYGAAFTGQVPIYFIRLARGVEGFDWFQSDDISQWLTQVSDVARVNQFRVSYRGDLDGYEVRLCPVDYWLSGLELKGTYAFDFYMGLPFVQERVPHLTRCIGGLLGRPANGVSRPFPGPKQIATFGEHKVELTRLHNDGPVPDGGFWRDGAYPPYTPDRMKAMDRCIERLHKQGIRVVPYFSLHELHPEAPPFADKADEWKRVVDEAGTQLHNVTRHGEYGAQMCLRSGWLDFRKRTIDLPLAHHAFDGIYYDWTFAIPCLNKAHAPFVHWDVEEFIDMLEWTRERVGPEGVVYLHMSHEPFIVAENLANVVLTYEEAPPEKVNPDMFPPHAQFMKTCSRVVLVRGRGLEEPKRFALCCLLNNVTPDSRLPAALDVFKAAARHDFSRYKRFENHRTTAAYASDPDVYAAVYWNEEEALVLLANLAARARGFTWAVDPAALGWGSDGWRVVGRAPKRLGACDFRYVKIRRET